MKKIIAKNDKTIEILVDDEDYEFLSSFKWGVYDRYADASIGNKTVKMHRLISGAKSSQCVDHINGNTIDNRRENLRLCSFAQNSQNRKLNKNSSTGAKGVQLMKNGKYRVRVQAFGKRNHIGVFETLNEAINARDKYAKEHHGEFYRKK